MEEITCEPTVVKAVERALDVLSCFTLEVPQSGLIEISNQTGLPKATVHRLLATLALRKFVEQDATTNLYRLGPKLLELGAIAGSQITYLAKAGPILKQLVCDVDETVAVAVLDGRQHVCTLVVEPERPVRVTTAVGVRRPCYFGAAGLVLLAYQPDAVLDAILPSDRLEAFTVWSVTDPAEYRRRLRAVRDHGYSIERGEAFSDVTALAAPIFDHAGILVATPAIVAPTHRVPDERVAVLLNKLLDATQRISEELGGTRVCMPTTVLATEPQR